MFIRCIELLHSRRPVYLDVSIIDLSNTFFDTMHPPGRISDVIGSFFPRDEYTCIPKFGEAMNLLYLLLRLNIFTLCKEEKERMGKSRGNERI